MAIDRLIIQLGIDQSMTIIDQTVRLILIDGALNRWMIDINQWEQALSLYIYSTAHRYAGKHHYKLQQPPVYLEKASHEV